MTSARSLDLELTQHRLAGRLVIFCGSDGSGKSTLIRAAIEGAQALGKKVVQVDLLSDLIRQLPDFRAYSHDANDFVRNGGDLFALSLTCAGNRLQNVRSLVLPQLSEGAWVFCDRYIFTTWAEFASFNPCSSEVRVLRAVLRNFPKPDLGILPYVSADVAIQRVRLRENERTKRLDEARISQLIGTYRAVAEANGLLQVFTARSLTECKAAVVAAVRTLTDGPTTLPTYLRDH